MNLVIYADISEDTWSVIICYMKGGYRIYKYGNKVTPVYFEQYPEQIVYYKVLLHKKDIAGDNKRNQGKNKSKYYDLPEYYQIIYSPHHYFRGGEL